MTAVADFDRRVTEICGYPRCRKESHALLYDLLHALTEADTDLQVMRARLEDRDRIIAELEQAYERLHGYEIVLGDAWADIFKLVAMHEDAHSTGFCDECGFTYPCRTARVLHRIETT